MPLALHEKSWSAWSEWSAMLDEEIEKAQAAGEPDTGETYERHWLATLERVVAGIWTCGRDSTDDLVAENRRVLRNTPVIVGDGEPSDTNRSVR